MWLCGDGRPDEVGHAFGPLGVSHAGALQRQRLAGDHRADDGVEEECGVQSASQHAGAFAAMQEIGETSAFGQNRLFDDAAEISVARGKHYADGFDADLRAEMLHDAFEHEL